jgi:hypothetical protein
VFQPEGTEQISSEPFEERAKLENSHLFNVREALLKPVQEFKKDVLSLLHTFARRGAIVQKKYFLISEIAKNVAKNEN